MNSRMRSKVIRVCETCFIFAMNCFVIVLGITVLGAMGFAIFQTFMGRY